MHKTVELITRWVDFEDKHPEGTLEEFCRYYLASKREPDANKLFEGEMPPRKDIILIKLIDRIARLHMVYIHVALKDLKINHFEEFSLLSAIANLNHPRKTEVIYHTINEISTGLKLLGDLKKRGYITESDDPEDKRSKRLAITAKGQKVLEACYNKFSIVPQLMCSEMKADDIDLSIQLLKNIEIKFSRLYMNHKDKSFAEVVQDIGR
jgi:DNA-binding MarR family transcriptional regulator